MKKFDKWFANITKEYPMYQNESGYSIGNVPALKAGWKAAIEMLQKVSNNASGSEHNCYYEIIDCIEEELKEE